jgi:hypothetical protein
MWILTSSCFMDAVGDRMLSETVAAICIKKSSNNNVNEFLKNVKMTPWHVTNDKKEKVVAEMVMKGGSVTSCGLFVCATNKCFAAKPDGVVFGLKDNKKATFRVINTKPRRSVNYLTALAQADLICSGFDVAVLVVGEELMEFTPDINFGEKMVEAMNFFREFMLPEIVKRALIIK